MTMALRMIVGFLGWKSPVVVSILLSPDLHEDSMISAALDAREVDMQTSSFAGEDPRADDGFQAFRLDEKEVKEKGSHCLDGSAPGFFIKEGKFTDKWAIQMQAGLGVCESEHSCHGRLPIEHGDSPGIEPILQKYKENGYTLLFLHSCDCGMWLGDRTEPVTYRGTKLYFQGARILKHTIDTILKNYTMKEVLLLGGSGGGQTLFTTAEYFRSLLPKSVTKFGIAPINGWYTLGAEDTFKYMFDLMNAKNIATSKCVKRMGEGQSYKCLTPSNVYDDLDLDVFITQVFDSTFVSHVDDTDWIEKETYSAWKACIGTGAEVEGGEFGSCTDERVEVLRSYMHNFTTVIKGFKKSQGKRAGGFLTTCTLHIFYSNPDYYWKYKNNGHTAEDAIWSWWNSLDKNPHSKWYLPCELASGPNPQCEPSCK